MEPVLQNYSLPSLVISNLMMAETMTELTKIYHECVDISRREKEAESEADPIQRRLKLFCPPKFDGLLCWNKTAAGTVASQPCPSFMQGFIPSRTAYRSCEQNGTWFLHPESQKDWSNYTTCIDTSDLRFRELVNDLYVIGYSISLVALLISLLIFFGFRSLKCTRIRIHVQLFVSLIMSCFLWITWYKFVVDDSDTVKDNPHWCIWLHIIIHYFLLCNYLWMFCEGMHLHLVLVVVFVKDDIALRWFRLIGWGVPVAIVGSYAYVRAFLFKDDTHSCWMHESQTMWILTVPIIVSLLSSVLFLVNVIRVLLTKLHPCSASPAPVGLRRAARATFILVPLFGLQNILLPLRPEGGSVIEPYYQVTSAVLVSLQGLCVSILFCFVNHDVLFAIRLYIYKRFPDSFNNARRDTSNNILHITPSREANNI